MWEQHTACDGGAAIDVQRLTRDLVGIRPCQVGHGIGYCVLVVFGIPRHQAGGVPEGSLVVATMTGHGLKDPENAVANAGVEPVIVSAELDAVKAVIGL